MQHLFTDEEYQGYLHIRQTTADDILRRFVELAGAKMHNVGLHPVNHFDHIHEAFITAASLKEVFVDLRKEFIT
jgi:hypothetical protein